MAAAKQTYGKPPVTALQEYCAKNNISLPTYDWIDSDDGSFICKVEAANCTAHGYGRSKREAKHDAAANIIKKLKSTHPELKEIPQATHETIPTTDMIAKLRDFCVQRNHPLPTIDLIQQTGPAEAPEFTAVCHLSTIKRYGVANNKKEAKQKAALEMLRVIADDVDKLEHQMQIVTIDNKCDDIETERYHKFKSYRELTDSKTGEVPGILLCDRHIYFTKFFPELKKAAYNVINTEYDCDKSKAIDIMSALKITPKITDMVTENSVEKYLLIELNCEYDVLIAGPESLVFRKVINYFKDML